MVQMFEEVQFPGDKYNDVWVPKPSFTQLELYTQLYKLGFGENRFDGPFPEVSVSRSSLDIGFISLHGQNKIAYEIDGPDHVEEYDKRRDSFLLMQRGWKVFRVDCHDIDSIGFEAIARMIYCHALYQFGLIKTKHWFPGVITSYSVVH